MFRPAVETILLPFLTASLLVSPANSASSSSSSSHGGVLLDSGLMMMESKARAAGMGGGTFMDDDASAAVIKLVESRQSSSSLEEEAGDATVLSQVADFTPQEMADWNTNTTEACAKALSRLTVASNPSGTSICYNLPLLETDTGKFVADLRLFQISPPTGKFANVDPTNSDNIKISMQYTSATANQVTDTSSSSSTSKRGGGGGGGGLLSVRQSSSPQELESHFFVGKINPELMKKGLTLELLEMWTTPIITLIGNSGNSEVRTGISTNEASFVSGVFSNEVVQSDTVLAALAVQDVERQLAEGTIAFILPGTDILIFPVGLVVTSVWMLGGFLVYGFGTFERYKHRDMFRRRRARATRGGERTF